MIYGNSVHFDDHMIIHNNDIAEELKVSALKLIIQLLSFQDFANIYDIHEHDTKTSKYLFLPPVSSKRSQLRGTGRFYPLE